MNEPQSKWSGRCSWEGCDRTKPPVAYGHQSGECFVHEMLGVFFQYEMYGEPDGWKATEELEPQYRKWIEKIEAEGVDLDAFAESFAKS